ncbi:bifunctional DNA primase/polymerase [Streptacidiphilus sp. PAMC 29251]
MNQNHGRQEEGGGRHDPGGVGQSAAVYGTSSMKRARRLKAALAFASMGWPVLGLSPGTNVPLKGCELCNPKSPHYVPHHGISGCPHPADFCHGFHAATVDEQRIRSIWDRFPDANVGISPGPASLVTVDCDTAKDASAPPHPYDLPGVVDGKDVLAIILERYGAPFPGDTLFVSTPRDGWHFYWTLPAGLVVNKSEAKFGWKIDVRSTGSYITAPTSERPEGEYRRLGDVLRPKEAPAWLLHHLEVTGHMPKPQVATPPRSASTAQPTRFMTGLVKVVLEAQEGERNSRLFWAACKAFEHAGAGDIDDHSAAGCLLDAALHIGLDQHEAQQTINSAQRAARGAA